MRPRSAPCGLWSLCTDEECAACPQTAVRKPGEPFRDAFEPDSAEIRTLEQHTNTPARAFEQVSGPAPFAFRMRR